MSTMVSFPKTAILIYQNRHMFEMYIKSSSLHNINPIYLLEFASFSLVDEKFLQEVVYTTKKTSGGSCSVV